MVVGRIGSSISEAVAARAGIAQWPPALGSFAAGCVWGSLPCAMTYGALFYAMLSGSWWGGAIVMLGFGLGTCPAILTAGLCLPLLRQRAQSALLRGVIGLMTVALGVATALVPAAKLAALCGFG